MCVPHPNHHQTLSCAVGPSSIHFAHSQSPATLCLSACHTRQSVTLLPQLPFLLLSVVFFIVILLVTIECVVVMECITCLHQSSTHCVCHFGAIQCGNHFALALLAVVPVVHHAIVLHVHTIFGQWMLLSGTHMASHSLHVIHFISHSTLLLPSNH